MSDVTFRWHGGEVTAKVKGDAGKRIDAASRYLRDRIREDVSRGQTTKGKGARKRGMDPSKPGESPKMVTAHLRRSIQQEYDRESQTARVGTNLLYGKFLQMGTTKMAARPWLSNGVNQHQAGMVNILSTGSAGGASTGGGGPPSTSEGGGSGI